MGIVARELDFHLLRSALAATLVIATGSAAAGDLTTHLDMRYRFESVDDAAFVDSARAHTLRGRLDLDWAFAERWRLVSTLESTQNLNDRFNSTRNGETGYPTVADPESSEIDQLFLAWNGARVSATLGRQRINLDNQRLIGAVGWRQNEQTFDALGLSAQLGDSTRLQYYYLDNVHRVFGDQNPNDLLAGRDLDAHLLNARTSLGSGRLTAFAYAVEDRDVALDSSRTFGLRYSTGGGFGDVAANTWSLSADLARQSDYANNPRDYGATYWWIEPSVTLGGITVRAGWEHLGGDGIASYRTPLATLHAFNGWADRFLTTPSGGLEDQYAGVAGMLGKASWSISWHRFQSDAGSIDYGNESDASIGMPLGHGFSGLIKLADFNGSALADTRKLWLQVEYKY